MKTDYKPLPFDSVVLDGEARHIHWFEPSNDNGGVRFAYYDPMFNGLGCLRTLKPSWAFKSLIHEFIHYIWSKRDLTRAVKVTAAALKGTEDDDEVEELFVSALADEAWEFLCQNRKMLAALKDNDLRSLLSKPSDPYSTVPKFLVDAAVGRGT